MTKYISPPATKGFFSSYKFQAVLGRYGAEEQRPPFPTSWTNSPTYVTGTSIHPDAQTVIKGVIFGISVLFTLHSIKSKAFLSKVPIQTCPYLMSSLPLLV